MNRMISGSFSALLIALSATAQAEPRPLLAAEQVFADFLDAYGAVETIDSGLLQEIDGQNRADWQRIREEKRTWLTSRLHALPAERLTPVDARAVRAMRRTFVELAGPGSSMTPDRKCREAAQPQQDSGVLQAALYACFDEVGNRLAFEGDRVTRGGALQRLQVLDEPARRKALFLAMAPLWESVNAGGQPGSPYRRMIAKAVVDFRTRESPVDEAARALDLDVAQLERWLLDVLEAWRRVNARTGAPIEPWDYRYHYARASRALNPAIGLDVLPALNQRFFEDLGADPQKLGVLFDLKPRPGKAPIAYADTVRIGRRLDGRWRPAIARISANYDRGGLYTLNELLHETGHAAHYVAIRTRPAFFWPDTLFIEAFADVPSWSAFDPAWQQKYLGRSVARSDALRELHSLVMLDVAWGLFELRMLRAPGTDPNALWTEITSRYLHVVPHPERSWWAVRAQLVSNPGYMINYAVGAILTADIRKRARESIGPFDAGNPRWYPWLSANLLRFGGELETPELLERFLGRVVSPAALVEEISTIAAD